MFSVASQHGQMIVNREVSAIDNNSAVGLAISIASAAKDQDATWPQTKKRDLPAAPSLKYNRSTSLWCHDFLYCFTGFLCGSLSLVGCGLGAFFGFFADRLCGFSALVDGRLSAFLSLVHSSFRFFF